MKQLNYCINIVNFNLIKKITVIILDKIEIKLKYFKIIKKLKKQIKKITTKQNFIYALYIIIDKNISSQ